MVISMQAGSVIVDLAVEAGGNCELSDFGLTVTTPNGVKIIGHTNVPARLAVDASALFARNLLNFIKPFVNAETGEFKLNFQDELVIGTLVTKDGKVVNERVVGLRKEKSKIKKSVAKKSAAKKTPNQGEEK